MFPKIKHIMMTAMVIMLITPFLCAVLIFGSGPLKQNTTLVIPHGTSTREIAGTLDDCGVIYNQYLFLIAARFLGHGSLKAGEYQYAPGQSIADIVLMMHEGHYVIHMFKVAEGLTSYEIAKLLQNSPALAGELTSVPAEGSLLPESYSYIYGDTRASLVERMQKAMQTTLNNLWITRDPAIVLKTPEEAVIMASVIEKETGKAVERPRIAGVFYNRLHDNMRLQSDPTVIYAMTQGKGTLNHELNHDDLSFASPINTYANDGLPPQPICNPGRAALEAALHPETNDYLYFVADGTGGHVFSKDLAAHNENVTKYRAQKLPPH